MRGTRVRVQIWGGRKSAKKTREKDGRDMSCGDFGKRV